MTPEQLLNLIGSYGAEPARWPRERKADAETLALVDDPSINNALAEARALDAALSSHFIVPPDTELVRRIMASAPVQSSWRQVIGLRTRWWLSGVVLVGAGLGGVAAGALAISLIIPVSTIAASTAAAAQGSSVGTTFGDVGVEGSE